MNNNQPFNKMYTTINPQVKRSTVFLNTLKYILVFLIFTMFSKYTFSQSDPYISGPSTACGGSVETYYLEYDACDYPYDCHIQNVNWSVTGGIITSSSDSYATVDWNTNTGTHRISVSCLYVVEYIPTGSTTEDQYNLYKDVTTTTTVPGAITGHNRPVMSTTQTYSISAVSGATAYQWVPPTGSTILSGQGTTSITMEIGSQQGDVKVRAQNVCGYGNYSTLNIIPQAPLSFVTDTIYITKDAMIYDNRKPGYEYCQYTNYGSYSVEYSWCWTHSGYPTYRRSLMMPDLSHIPQGATIVSAKLYLYGVNDHKNDVLDGSPTYKPNTSYIERITQSWDETQVCWYNKPSVTSTNRITLANSTSRDQDYLDQDVTALVQDMVNNPSTSHGFNLKLASETYYTRMTFASSDNTDPTHHPKLVVTYNLPGETYTPEAAVSNYSLSRTTTKNFIHTVVPKTPMTSIPGPTSSRDPDDIAESITYFDGLGRPIQQNAISAATNGADVIQPIAYHNKGTESISYLAYKNSGLSNHGAYKTSALTDQESFYTSQFGSTDGDHAYTKTIYDFSPLGRVTEQSAPGEDWQISGDGYFTEETESPSSDYDAHTVKYKYYPNTNYVYRYDVDPVNGKTISGFISSTQRKEGTYGYTAGDLMVTEVMGENWMDGDPGGITREYKDKSGNVVLKESVLDATTTLKTWYVYDDFGRLRCIIPPKANGVFSDTKYCFYYAYDIKGRIIEKQVPGAEPEYYVYNKRDQLALTQDGKQRDKVVATDKEWLFTKYDALHRPIMTGIYKSSASRSTLQTALDAATPYNSTGTAMLGYTNDAYPTGADEDDYFTITFYDDYSFFDRLTGFTQADYAYSLTGVPSLGFETGYSNRTKGKITGSLTRVLKSNGTTYPEWLLTVSYYDEYGRVIQVVGDNHLWGQDRITTKYDFTGNVLAMVQQHGIDGEYDDHMIVEKYEYDHTGRLLRTFHKVDSETEVMLTAMKYNEMGGLKEKYLHGPSSGTGSVLQKLDFGYNIRGWLTNINDPTGLGSDLFGMQLAYNDVSNMPDAMNPTPLYDGNIAATLWNTQQFNVVEGQKGYQYSYDDLNRLTGANYGAQYDWKNKKYDVTGITYDVNGNLLTLNRKNAEEAFMDSLAYNYHGNRLIGINDRSGNAYGFNDIVSGDLSNPSTESTWEYKYDDSGNLVYNNNNDADYCYNHLNLPDKVDFNGSTNILEFTYDAAGNLLNKKAGSNTVEYVGNFVYEDGQLIYILMPEGRIVVTSTTKTYEYHVTDHLGNVRVAFEAKSYGAEVTQLSDYYPFGYRHLPVALNNDNNYLYSGKELFEDYGFGWYYFGARFYDAAVGRWNSIDPRASKYSGISPYGAMANNPITYVDPDGESLLVFLIGFFVSSYLCGVSQNDGEFNPFEWDPDKTDLAEMVAWGLIGGFGGNWIEGIKLGTSVLTIGAQIGAGAGALGIYVGINYRFNNDFSFKWTNNLGQEGEVPFSNAVKGDFHDVTVPNSNQISQGVVNAMSNWKAGQRNRKRFAYPGELQLDWMYIYPDESELTDFDYNWIINMDGFVEASEMYPNFTLDYVTRNSGVPIDEPLINVYPEAYFSGSLRLMNIPYRGGFHYSSLGYHYLGKTTTRAAGELPGMYLHLNIYNRHLIINKNLLRHIKYFKYLK